MEINLVPAGPNFSNNERLCLLLPFAWQLHLKLTVSMDISKRALFSNRCFWERLVWSSQNAVLKTSSFGLTHESFTKKKDFW